MQRWRHLFFSLPRLVALLKLFDRNSMVFFGLHEGDLATVTNSLEVSLVLGALGLKFCSLKIGRKFKIK